MAMLSFERKYRVRGGTLVVTTQAPRSQNVPQLQDSRARVAVDGMLHPR